MNIKYFKNQQQLNYYIEQLFVNQITLFIISKSNVLPNHIKLFHCLLNNYF